MDEAHAQRPSRSLSGKTAIVTGAGSARDGIGNGRASAILLAEAGANVLAVDLNKGNADRTVEMIDADGKGKAVAFVADVTDEKQCQGIVAEAVKQFGRVDILINVVGIIGALGTAEDVDMQEWAKSMEINVATCVMLSKYAIPEMIKNEGESIRGSIVNIGSLAGLRGGAPSLVYPASKGAVVNMTRAMAFHHAPQRIRVNCVCPGFLYTPMMYEGGMTPEVREARKGRSLLNTEGTAWDTGAAVRYLASDEARFVTGTILTVDGGVLSSTPFDGMPTK